jgi:hypothetical protein
VGGVVVDEGAPLSKRDAGRTPPLRHTLVERDVDGVEITVVVAVLAHRAER